LDFIITNSMKYLKHFLFVTTLLHSVSCSAQNCKEPQDGFSTYSEVTDFLNSTKFTYTDHCNTSKSSWVVSASYYSCDNKQGFFVFNTKKKTYTHKNVPKSVWLAFKKSDSFGKFYNDKIKGNYQLVF